MTLRDLSIWLPGRKVGELRPNAEGRVKWVPDEGWESDGQHPRLGAEVLRQAGPRPPVPGLPRWFENLLPEAESELRRRLCSAHSLRLGQSFALLRILGSDLVGAAQALPSPSVEGDALTAEAEHDTPTADVEDVEPTSAATGEGWKFSALAGMQMKFSMSMINQRLAVPAKGSSGFWIVKFPGEKYPDLALVETVTMTWARHSGFDVPDHFSVPIDRLDGIPADWVEGGCDAFAVKRFDRREDGSKIHQEDLCQAINLDPSNKYGNETPRVTFDGALRFVTDVCGEPSGREMARRLGFAIASGNTDAHLKNWSLSWGDRNRPTLTPCYDLVATITWANRFGWARRGGPLLALRTGEQRLFAKIDEKALAVLAKKSDQAWAPEEVREGIARARAGWESVVERAPEPMRRALDVHRASVPLLRSMW